MPDETTARALSRSQYLVIIKDLWQQSNECPICGHSEWNIGDMVEIPLRTQGTDLAAALMSEQRQAYLFMPITCTTCGYTHFFNLSVLNERGAERGPGQV